MKLQLKIAFLISIIFSIATSADDNIPERVSFSDPHIDFPDRIISVGEYEVKNKEVIEVYNWAYKKHPTYKLLDEYTPYSSYKLYIKLVATSSSLTLKMKKVYNTPPNPDDPKKDDEFREYILLSAVSKIRFNKNKKEFYLNDKTDEDNTVVGISWHGAFMYCYFLNRKKEFDYLFYQLAWDKYYYSLSSPAYRLPTEKEWLKYAKASQNFSGSDTVEDVAWYKYNSDRKLRTGKQKKAHKQLFDLTGNGWEWCFDDYYENFPVGHKYKNREYRVARGGSWGFTEETCSFKGNRRGYPQSKTRNDIGFRIVTYIYPSLSIKQPKE